MVTGVDYYGGTRRILVLEQHYTCSFTCNHQNPHQIFHELNGQKIALNIRDRGSCSYEIDKESYLEATVEYALHRPDLKDKFLEYLKGIVD